MTKTVLVSILLLLCFKLSWSQRPMSDKAVVSIYKAPITASAELAAANQTYLVKFNDPLRVQHQYHILKRISYNYFIISHSPQITTDLNVKEISAATPLWKAADNLVKTWQKHPGKMQTIEVTTAPSDSAISRLNAIGQIISRNGNLIRINIKNENLPALLQNNFVLFANEVRKAHEELAVNDIDLGINTISAIQATQPEITGKGINVAIKEDRYDDDLDLLGRSFASFGTAAFTSGHATTMATLIGGNGNSYIKGKGTAPDVKFTSSTFENLMPDSDAIFKKFNISIQNHSYGTGIENYYGTESVAYDKQIYQNDSLVHVFSSGNIGTTAPETGIYSGINGFANLSGDFKQAKNVLVVGGTGRTGIVEDLSSAGPTFDGRIKPEIVADGEDGTSGAAALTSGAVALLQQAYKKQTGHQPSSALIKGILINTADEIGDTPGPAYKTGYGSLNALEAVRTINNKQFISGVVTNAGATSYQITVPDSCKELKVTLAWNDAPADVNTSKALVNNLDLSVTTPGGQTILPWVLSSFPSADSLKAPASRKIDTINNVEQVTLSTPSAGAYTIHVKGSRVTTAKQQFDIAYRSIITNHFEWIYPSANDQLFADDDNYLRWQSSFTDTQGKISVSYDNGTTWQQLTNAQLKNRYYTWHSPDIFTKAILKMQIGQQTYYSKPFSTSRPLVLNVGYNCTDGTLLQWHPQPGNKGYTVYIIKNNLLQKLATTADTLMIIPASNQTSVYYAVSAAGDGFEGIKSYTINVTTQGVGCYVKTLLASIVNNTAVLNLDLGSSFNLKTISWEKLTAPGTFTTLATVPVSSATNYQYTDSNLKQGKQTYRAKLTTVNGTIIYSNPADATYLQPQQFVIYPNPVADKLNILSGDLNNYQIKLYSVDGRLNITQNFNELQNSIPVRLVSGVYVYVIELNGKVIYNGKLVKI
ncbi:S8 family peptidase [Mucilaginibacter celer]|uniref:T9SS C-terminal target domain-containing protein n=1 Tax=Mucilaginibacter celer TaxID=2305508 RepID=A0A494W0K5_9SPHI|nr:S8 family peptidase [Mucilaginibacter celer]AYL97088.1 T9SS C-terminal target domain-containing protein [Mucilaginibacter celer]